MPRPIRGSLALVGVLVLSALCQSLLAADAPQRIKDFSLPDIYGRERSLSEFDSRVVVVAFLGAECPLARLYAPRLQELADQYAAQGATFVAIDANVQDSLTEMAAYARQYGVKFPLLKDRDASVADQFGAVRTPEVFVLDRDRVVRYHGRIDDQYGLGASSGYARSEIKERNLGRALDELLAGKEVSEPSTEPLGCLIGRKTKSEPQGEITYTKHIAAIVQDRCVLCHREGQIGPFALLDYHEVAGWGAMIKEVVSDGRMPPWSANPDHGHFINDPRLSEQEKQLLFAWIDNGCPEGDPKDLPKQREWVDGWMIPKPDQVFYMPKPFKVPAEGVVNYQNFTVDTGWTEDKYIQFSEAKPGNKGVVHHIIVNVNGPSNRARTADEEAEVGGEPSAPPTGRQSRGAGGRGGSEGLDAVALRGGKLTAYTPGRNSSGWRDGMALYCPAGSKLTFQMHYTTNGTECEDQSYVGVVFADPKNVTHLVRTSSATNGTFAIPPHTDNYKVTSETVFRTDQTLLNMTPHMHVRGKAMRYEAFYPDGSSEILLDVPKFDFNWQIQYELAEPKRLPAGTKLFCTAYFDNSENNLANPNPNETVKWGPQTWEEMMIGWFCTIVDRKEAGLAVAEPSNQPVDSAH